MRVVRRQIITGESYARSLQGCDPARILPAFIPPITFLYKLADVAFVGHSTCFFKHRSWLRHSRFGGDNELTRQVSILKVFFFGSVCLER